VVATAEPPPGRHLALLARGLSTCGSGSRELGRGRAARDRQFDWTGENVFLGERRMMPHAGIPLDNQWERWPRITYALPAFGTEPADWMSAVLRGRNLPLEQSLWVLTQAIEKQVPRHMLRMAKDEGRAHVVLVPAFLGKEPMWSPSTGSMAFRWLRCLSYPWVQ
jgi:hypothetical protein